MTARFGHRLRRFLDHKSAGQPYQLNPLHPAIRESRTMFAARVSSASETRPLLKSGHNNRKIGGKVVKGKWSGMPLFTLTLEERRTCPPTCHHWLSCFGNKMNWSTRVRPDDDLIPALDAELASLARCYPRGFVVRLHVLGDFFSTEYVEAWLGWLDRYPPLRVFGYTAWQSDTPIGGLIAAARETRWDRFAVRTSDSGNLTHSTVSVWHPDQAEKRGAIVCPAQTERTECCGTCSLCWATTRPIGFLVH